MSADEMTAWLRAQVEADIAKAKIATDGPWEADGSAIRGAERAYSGGRPGVMLVVKHTWPQEATHIIAHDPLTETARAESMLAVLDFHDLGVTWERAEGKPLKRVEVLRIVVRRLAEGYRHREGYKPEWGS